MISLKFFSARQLRLAVVYRYGAHKGKQFKKRY